MFSNNLQRLKTGQVVKLKVQNSQMYPVIVDYERIPEDNQFRYNEPLKNMVGRKAAGIILAVADIGSLAWAGFFGKPQVVYFTIADPIEYTGQNINEIGQEIVRRQQANIVATALPIYCYAALYEGGMIDPVLEKLADRNVRTGEGCEDKFSVTARAHYLLPKISKHQSHYYANQIAHYFKRPE